jgi:hypothetical protein
MATDNSTSIGGTVIERAFVAEDVPSIIHVATVPMSEIGFSSSPTSEDNLRAMVAELFALPATSIVDETQFQEIRKLAEEPHLFMRLAMDRPPFPHPHHPFFEDLIFRNAD